MIPVALLQESRTLLVEVQGMALPTGPPYRDSRAILSQRRSHMDTAHSANLLLKLYELRTEDTLRRARAWFAFEFHPTSAKEVVDTWLGPGEASAPYRMVTTYWDMAASLVLQGAIDAQMFNAANTEHVAFYAKLRPFLSELRATTK